MNIIANAFAYAAITSIFAAIVNLWFHGPDPLMVGMLTFAGFVCGSVQREVGW